MVDSWLSQSHLNEKLEQKENLEHHLCTVVAKLKIQSARSWVEIQIEESGSCPRNLDIISVWIKLAGGLDYVPFEENQLIPFSLTAAIVESLEIPVLLSGRAFLFRSLRY